MYAITGAFGQTGVALSKALLDAGKSIRMIVRRDDAQAAQWREKGAEVVIADICDTASLTQAFHQVEAVLEELKLTDAMDRHFKLLFSVAETIVFQN